MNWFSNLIRRTNRLHFIGIDIGSNTAIRSLHFEEANSEAILIKKKHFELPFREDARELIPLMKDYLKKLLEEYIRDIGRVPNKILVGLGNHFTFNQMATIARERSSPSSPVLESEIQAALREFLEDQSTKTLDGRTYRLAHLMPFRISVDGYHIDSLGPKTHGRTIEIVVFATYAETEFWKALSELRLALGGLELRFISNQAAIGSMLVSVLGLHDALIIKVGARITEISLLGDDAIRFTGQFNGGGDDVTDAISRRLGVKRQDAERMKRQWGTLIPPDGASVALQDSVRSAVAGWVQKFVELLKSDERFAIPEQVLLLGGGARLQAIRDALTSLPWFNELTFLDRLDIRELDAEDIAEHIFRNQSTPLAGPEEVALASLAARLSSKQLSNP